MATSLMFRSFKHKKRKVTIIITIQQTLQRMNDSAKEIYLSNHGRSLIIRIGQNYTTYMALRGSPQNAEISQEISVRFVMDIYVKEL